MQRVIHFEIALKDPDKTGKFYSDVFGWKVNKWPGPVDYWLVETGDKGPGIDGGILKAGEAQAPVVNTIGVENLDTMMEKVKAAGGSIATPKHTIPTIGWFCYARDPEGIPFGMLQPDENAK